MKRLHNTYKSERKASPNDMISVINDLSIIFKLKQINYSYIEYSEDRDNDGFHMIRVSHLDELATALSQHDLFEISAVFISKEMSNEHETITLFLKPDSKHISIVYYYVFDTQSTVIEEFEAVCMRYFSHLTKENSVLNGLP